MLLLLFTLDVPPATSAEANVLVFICKGKQFI